MMKRQTALIAMLLILIGTDAAASGFGVFTQGAKGLGQANAVVAHPTGPSSLYFNPALLSEVPGRQIEVGTTAISIDREFTSAGSGAVVQSDDEWNFPSTLYYTHQGSDQLTSGFGIYFPFGLSNSWEPSYEGRYIATSGEIFSLNINPAAAYRVSDRLSLAAGLDVLYLSARLDSRINQVFAGLALPPAFGGPVIDPTMPDVIQTFDGEGWGSGYNLGLFYRFNETFAVGAAYRSHIDVKVSGDSSFGAVDPRLALLFPAGPGETEIRLPQQFTAGLAIRATPRLVVEVGVRWEDWQSTRSLVIDLDRPVLGQQNQIIPRDWQATWSYNIGGEFRLTDTVSLLAGYLYGEAAVPASTFEPLLPDTDAHLFSCGAEVTLDAWTLAAAFGYEHHEEGIKNNAIGDPLDPTGINPLSFANGTYDTDVLLASLSLGYRF